MSRHYTKEDSQEIRKIYFEAVRKNPPKEKQKLVISQKEWNHYKKIGADMSRFELLLDFQNRPYKEELERRRNEKNKK